MLIKYIPIIFVIFIQLNFGIYKTPLMKNDAEFELRWYKNLYEENTLLIDLYRDTHNTIYQKFIIAKKQLNSYRNLEALVCNELSHFKENLEEDLNLHELISLFIEKYKFLGKQEEDNKQIISKLNKEFKEYKQANEESKEINNESALDLKKQYSKLESANKDLKLQLQEKEIVHNENVNLKKEIQQKIDIISKIEEENKKLEEKHDKFNKKTISDYENLISENKKHLKNSEEEKLALLRNLESQLQDSRSKITLLMDDKVKLIENHANEIRKTEENYRKKLKETEKKIINTMINRKIDKNMIKNAHNSQDSLTACIEHVIIIDKLQSDIISLENKIKNMADSVQSKNDLIIAETNKYQLEINKLKHEINILKNENSNLKAEIQIISRTKDFEINSLKNNQLNDPISRNYAYKDDDLMANNELGDTQSLETVLNLQNKDEKTPNDNILNINNKNTQFKGKIPKDTKKNAQIIEKNTDNKIRNTKRKNDDTKFYSENAKIQSDVQNTKAQVSEISEKHSNNEIETKKNKLPIEVTKLKKSDKCRINPKLIGTDEKEKYESDLSSSIIQKKDNIHENKILIDTKNVHQKKLLEKETQKDKKLIVNTVNDQQIVSKKTKINLKDQNYLHDPKKIKDNQKTIPEVNKISTNTPLNTKNSEDKEKNAEKHIDHITKTILKKNDNNSDRENKEKNMKPIKSKRFFGIDQKVKKPRLSNSFLKEDINFIKFPTEINENNPKKLDSNTAIKKTENNKTEGKNEKEKTKNLNDYETISFDKSLSNFEFNSDLTIKSEIDISKIGTIQPKKKTIKFKKRTKNIALSFSKVKRKSPVNSKKNIPAFFNDLTFGESTCSNIFPKK